MLVIDGEGVHAPRSESIGIIEHEDVEIFEPGSVDVDTVANETQWGKERGRWVRESLEALLIIDAEINRVSSLAEPSSGENVEVIVTIIRCKL